MARKRQPSLLTSGISLTGMGIALFVVPSFFAGRPLLAPIGQALRGAAPYLLCIGLLMLVLHFALRPQRGGQPPGKTGITWFGNDSTDFAPRLDGRDSVVAQEPAFRGQRAPAATWGAQVFRDIEWRRFEAVCAELFAQAGFKAKTQSHGADGGVDIWLYSDNAKGPAALVQCKHWPGRAVGVKELREFYGVMASHKLVRGTFATTGTYTPDARDFAKSNGISALDGQGLLALISQRTPTQQQALLKTAHEGEYWRPTCAGCGLKMVERQTRKDGKGFWGCADFPRCRSTLPMRGA